ILMEVHVELPMQVVLDSPVVSQPAAVVPRAGPLVADEIADLRGGLPLHGPLTVTHADGGQARPGVRTTNPLGGVQDRIAPILLTPMATLARLVGIVVQAGEVGVERPRERLLDVFE